MSRNGKQRAYKAQSVQTKATYNPEEDIIEADYQSVPKGSRNIQNDTLRKLLVILAVFGGNLLQAIKQIDWRKHSKRVLRTIAGGLKQIAAYIFSFLSEIHESIAPQYRTVTYITTALLITVLPLVVMLFFPMGDKLSSNNSNGFDIPINQQGTSLQSQSRLAPFFSPSVHYWSEDILRWSESTGFDANYLATIMQIESCGNPLYMNGERLGLFAVPQSQFLNNEAFNDVDTNAIRAIERLEQGMNLTQADSGMTLAYYHGGDIVLQSDFATWTLEMRDIFIFGRLIYRDAQNGLAQSEVFNQWWEAKGAALCQQASMTLDMTMSR